jgi:hypothetical protein
MTTIKKRVLLINMTWAFATTCTVILVGAFLCPRLLAQDAKPMTDLSLEVADFSSPGSPFQASGQIHFYREFSAASMQTRMDGDVRLKNISPKPVVAFECVVVTGLLQIDHFVDAYFNGDDIQSGDEVTLVHESKSNRAFTEQYRGSSPTSFKPDLHVTVLYVEFADGSTYGGGQIAESRAADRRTGLNYLNELSDAYENDPINLIPTLNGLLARGDPMPLVTKLGKSETRNPSVAFSILNTFEASLNSNSEEPTKIATTVATVIRLYLKTAAHRGFIS